MNFGQNLYQWFLSKRTELGAYVDRGYRYLLRFQA